MCSSDLGMVRAWIDDQLDRAASGSSRRRGPARRRGRPVIKIAGQDQRWNPHGIVGHAGRIESNRGLEAMLAFILEQLEVAFLRNRQSRDASGGKSDHRNAVRIDERLARQPGESTVSVGGARRGLARTGIADATRREAVDDVDLRGAGVASPSPEVTEAIAGAQAIVIGPSNPIISIGPILGTPGMREAIAGSSVPVVAVSPLVGGTVVKGPTAVFMEWAGHPLSSDGIAAVYDGLIDGLVADERTEAVPTLQIDVSLGTPKERRTVAEQTLRFAQALV